MLRLLIKSKHLPSSSGFIRSNLSRIPPNPQIVLNLVLANQNVSSKNVAKRDVDKLEQLLKAKESEKAGDNAH